MRSPAHTPDILFRADASPRIGIGHVMRCLTLADVLAQKGYSIGFVCTPETLDTVPRLSRSGHGILGELPKSAALLVIDHYGLGEEYERAASSHADRMMVIDDLPTRRHACDLLLDQTFGREIDEWRPLLGSQTTTLIGAQYALLRPDFIELRPAALARRIAKPAERILISLGGTDPDNITGAILSALDGMGMKIGVDVVMGSHAPHLDAIRSQIAGKPITLHIDVESLAPLMLKADLAIGAGGTTSWERCCLGLPTVILEIADNQHDIIRHLLAAEAAFDGGSCAPLDHADFRDRITSAARDSDRLSAVAANAARLCDGNGAWRVADAVASLLSSRSRTPL